MNYARLLEGKNVLITAGAHGMGFSTARLFAQHGATIAICGRRAEGEKSAEFLRQYSPNSFFRLTDMEDKDQVEAFCDEALERLDHIDIVVNNVGINSPQAVFEMTEDKYEHVQKTNIKPVVYINRKLIPRMIEHGTGGAFVHISTIHSRASFPTYRFGSYAVSKGGINAYSRVMALELGKYGIRSNVLCPGGITTGRMINPDRRPLSEVLPERGDDGSQPLWGPGHAQDIANGCLFLASPLSGYVTGWTMMCDGGTYNQAHYVENFPKPDDMAEQLYHYGKTFISDEDWMKLPLYWEE